MKHPRLVVVVLLITAVLAAEWVWLRLRDQPSTDRAAPAVPVGAALPGGPFALTDHLGNAVTSDDFAGDLLLIFVKDEDYRFGEREQFELVWVYARHEDLVAADDCPAPGWEFVTCHGIRHRTHDDPGLYGVLESESGDCEIELGVPVAEATKIGGALYDPQDVDPEVPSGTRLLCALSSIQAIPGRPWPWANREAALDSGFGEDGIHHHTNQLMISDMGTLNFLLDARGEVEVYAGSY